MSESTALVVESDEERLAQLGYKQELHRRLSGFSNFAVSFSIISILAGAITSYCLAMNDGGPVAITIGWLVRRRHGHARRAGHGRGRLGLPDRRRPLLVGLRAGQAQQAGVGLVRRLVQLPRRGRGDRRHRLRRGHHHDGVPQPHLGLPVQQVEHVPGQFLVIIVAARAAEHVRRQPGEDAVRRQRLVAPGRRGVHRGRAGRRARPPLLDSETCSSQGRTPPASPSPAPRSTRC